MKCVSPSFKTFIMQLIIPTPNSSAVRVNVVQQLSLSVCVVTFRTSPFTSIVKTSNVFFASKLSRLHVLIYTCR